MKNNLPLFKEDLIKKLLTESTLNDMMYLFSYADMADESKMITYIDNFYNHKDTILDLNKESFIREHFSGILIDVSSYKFYTSISEDEKPILHLVFTVFYTANPTYTSLSIFIIDKGFMYGYDNVLATKKHHKKGDYRLFTSITYDNINLIEVIRKNIKQIDMSNNENYYFNYFPIKIDYNFIADGIAESSFITAKGEEKLHKFVGLLSAPPFCSISYSYGGLFDFNMSQGFLGRSGVFITFNKFIDVANLTIQKNNTSTIVAQTRMGSTAIGPKILINKKTRQLVESQFILSDSAMGGICRLGSAKKHKGEDIISNTYYIGPVSFTHKEIQHKLLKRLNLVDLAEIAEQAQINFYEDVLKLI